MTTLNVFVSDIELLSVVEPVIHHPCSFLLSAGTHKRAKRSYFSLCPIKTLSLFPCDYLLNEKRIKYPEGQGPWDLLQQIVASQYDRRWMGYLCYEMGAFCQEKPVSYTPPSYPLASFSIYAINIEVDHCNAKVHISIDKECLPHLPQDVLDWLASLHNKSAWKVHKKFPSSVQPAEEISPFLSEMEYKELVEMIQEWIREGDVYQVNLSHEQKLHCKENPWLCFTGLVQKNPSPYMAYIHTPFVAIASSSPELFLEKIGTDVSTAPIKGTVPRAKSEMEDTQNKQALIGSEKEAAELFMITDLMRNDFGKHALPGSVQASRNRVLETYQYVHHMVSEVQAQFPEHISSVEIVQNCFPAGSVTGCPKLSAMEKISLLEKRARGVYTGSIGFFEGDRCIFNVAIRTIAFAEQTASIQSGGAVVIDSDSCTEFEETKHKARSLQEVLLSV